MLQPRSFELGHPFGGLLGGLWGHLLQPSLWDGWQGWGGQGGVGGGGGKGILFHHRAGEGLETQKIKVVTRGTGEASF